MRIVHHAGMNATVIKTHRNPTCTGAMKYPVTNGLTTYTWDDRGYLIKLEKPGATLSYTYNALGARTSKTVTTSQTTVTTKYVTAPIFGMNHVLMELDSSNNVTARYVYGGHEQLIAEPSPDNTANDQYLLHGGSVGNVTHAVSRSGAVQNEYGYDAFGNRTLVSGSVATRFGYTGEESDAESGLLYLRARYYDPVIGRFISVDPYLGRLAEPATQNRYVYVRNNPMIYVDPSGHATLDITGAAFYGGGASASLRFDTESGNLYLVPASGVGRDIGVSFGMSMESYDGQGRFVASVSVPVSSIGLSIGGEKTLLGTPTSRTSGSTPDNKIEYSISSTMVEPARFNAGARVGGSIRYEQPIGLINGEKVSNWFSEMNRGIDSFLRECK